MSDPAVLSALRELYTPPEWLVLGEVRSGTGAQEETRYADGVAVNLWPSKHEIIGFEFKVAENVRHARADLRRELARPEKAREIGRFCSRWYLVVRAPWKHIVFDLDAELPEGCGLIEAGTGVPRIVRQSEQRSPEPMTEAFMLSLLRSASEQAKSEEALPPLRVVTRPRASRDMMGLSCGHEIPRLAFKKVPQRARCAACAAAGTAPESILSALESEIRRAAETFSEDEAAAIVTAGGVAVDAVRAALPSLTREPASAGRVRP